MRSQRVYDMGSRSLAFTPDDILALRRQARAGHSFAIDWRRALESFDTDDEDYGLCAFTGCVNPRRSNAARYCLEHSVDTRGLRRMRAALPKTLEERMAVVKVIKRRRPA